MVKETERRLQAVVFHVKDLDMEATVKEGLKTVLGEEEIKVSALRPAYGGTQNATVTVPGLGPVTGTQEVSGVPAGTYWLGVKQGDTNRSRG